MSKEEARALIEEKLASYRHRPYAELVKLIDEPDVFEVIGPSGAKYQIEFQAP